MDTGTGGVGSLCSKRTQSLSAGQCLGLLNSGSVPGGLCLSGLFGFRSNDCLILRSFKHVKTVDSRAAYLFGDRLNYTSGIHHRHKEKRESLENQTWKISTLNHTATFSTQGTGHCSLKPLSIYSFLWVYIKGIWGRDADSKRVVQTYTGGTWDEVK